MSAQAVMTRAWKAWDTDRSPSGQLCVTGQVCVNSDDIHVRLRAREPQGVDPRTLLIELTVSGEAGGHRAGRMWKTATYAIDCAPARCSFEHVVVFYDDQIVADIGVVR